MVYKVEIISMRIKNSTIFIILTLGWGAFLYYYGLVIKGPFIFGDESTYFSFARSIFHQENLASYTQYGPLYPALISVFFGLKNTVMTYQAVRIFNLIVFLSSVIPAYLLADRLFINRWLKVLLPFCVLITPFSGLICLVWAEPLYIALFYWTSFLFYCHIKKPNVINSFLLSIFLAALYYTKPAAGLIVLIAAFIALLMLIISKVRESDNKGQKLLSIVVILMSSLVVLPWMLRYIHLGLSIIGYPGASADFALHVKQQGYLLLFFNVLCSAFYQFSYVFVGSFGLITVGIFLVIKKFRYLSNVERYTLLFILLAIFGLMTVSALGMASGSTLDYRMPQGRYYSLFLPLIITLVLSVFLNNGPEKNVKWLIALVLLTAAIAMIASPFYCLSGLALNSMPDLSPFIFILEHGADSGRALIATPPILLRIIVPALSCMFVLGIIVLHKRAIVYALASMIIVLCMIFSTYAEQHYIVDCAVSQTATNNIYRFIVKNHININDVVFDKKIEAATQTPFFTPFWTGKSSVVFETQEKSLQQPQHYFVSSEPLKLNKVYTSDQYVLYQTH